MCIDCHVLHFKKVPGLKFKFNSQCISEIDFIIIIKISTQVINSSSKFWQKKKEII